MRSAWLGLLALVACSGANADPAQATSQAVVNGTTSAKAQDFVVQIAIEKSTKMIPYCTGTMIAKSLVITARHCVGELDADEIKVADFVPSKLAIYVGTDAGPRTAKHDPDAYGAKLFTDGTKEVALDIAVLLLDRALDVPTAPIRLASGAKKGEALDIVGYGITEDDRYPMARQQRTGLEVVRTGPGKSKLFELLEGEFQLGEAACSGDSGGPALSSETGALVGIASRVSNGTDRSDATPSSFCLGSAAEDVYTDLTPAKAFIEKAFAAAEATPWLEGEPSPEEKAAAEAEEEENASKSSPPAPASSAGCSATGHPPSSLAVLAAVGLLCARARSRSRNQRGSP